MPFQFASPRIFIPLLAWVSSGVSVCDAGNAPLECDKSIDLRETGGAMEKMPIVSQGYSITNLCGFFTGSAMIDSFRKTAVSRDAKFISPIALAVELAIDADMPIWFPIQNTTDPLTNVPGRWGQMVCPVLKFARKNGACVDPALKANDIEASARLADKTTTIYAVLFEWGMLKKKKRDESLTATAEKVNRLFSEMEPKPEKPLEIVELARWMSENEEKPYNVIHKLFFQGCDRPENRILLNNLPDCQSAYYGSLDFFGIHVGKSDPLRTRGAIAKINELLDRPNPKPVSMAFCGSFLREGHAYPGRSILSEACSAHWVLVIGRKKINGRCHVLLRNSAKPVAVYSHDWIRDPIENRDVWVDEEALNRAIYALQWME